MYHFHIYDEYKKKNKKEDGKVNAFLLSRGEEGELKGRILLSLSFSFIT